MVRARACWASLGDSGLLDLARQYAKFGVVGLSATAVHASVFAILIEAFGLRAMWANLLAFGLAVIVSYLGNFHWTFRPSIQVDSVTGSAGAPLTFAKFVVVAVTGLLLNSIAVFLVVDVFSLSYVYALIPMVGMVPVIVFALSKLWAFRPA